MSIKGDASRTKILDVSRKLFAHKGYSKVTMHDICTLANISRGGLYRHYSSTEEIFAEIIKRDEDDAFDALTNAVKNGISGKIMFSTFLTTRIATLTDPEMCIDNAISEFAANSTIGKELLSMRAKNSVRIISEIIELGCNDGSFSCNDCESVGKMILWILEGMGKHNALVPLTDQEISKQVELIENLLEQK